jgi:FkbM family methyltransferase
MLVSTRDDIGLAVLHLGVFDLLVTETIFRLADAGETALDVGANIGYMTAILAAAVAPTGTVFSFEPHPQLFDELSRNIELAVARFPQVRFHPQNVALSDRPGTVSLAAFDPTASNRGTSQVLAHDASASVAANVISVPANRLDEVIDPHAPIGVMKLDVEGHELAVLAGAEKLFDERRARDVIFEEHREYPTDVTRCLLKHGFELFRLHRRFSRPQLLPPDSAVPRSRWESTSFLATLDPGRARARFDDGGWSCLSR